MTLSIYLTVTGWSYAVVTVVGLLQGRPFRTHCGTAATPGASAT
ncbi:MAG: hypothetical protein R2742_10900 [Micropruina glycogenica]